MGDDHQFTVFPQIPISCVFPVLQLAMLVVTLVMASLLTITVDYREGASGPFGILSPPLPERV